MGGNAAKERRRLKRLAEQQKLDGESHGEDNKKAKVDSVVASKNTDSSADKKVLHVDQKNISSKQHQIIKKNKPLHHESGKTIQRGEHKGVQSKKNQLNNRKSSNKIPIKAKKVKKPKHLARKLMNTSDPEIISQLTNEKKTLDEKKLKRRDKFKAKVIELVGGEKFFNSIVFDELMEQGGGKIETIVKAVKLGSKEVSKKKTPTPKLIKENKNDKIKDNRVDPVAGESNDTPEIIDSPPLDIESNKAATVGGDSLESNEGDATLRQESTIEENKVVDSDSSSSSESEDEGLNIPSGRTRGRRRRGRQEADAKREENDKEQSSMKNEEQIDSNVNNTTESPATNDTKTEQRRCIGRRALTDFEVGKKYTGTVVYIKPKLGLFIDINCHSDAFCHISRCVDTYVETIDDFYKVGDILEDKVRIVNIDRKAKKITVSLQSDERIKDEEKSNESWKKRLMERKNAKRGRIPLGKKNDEYVSANENNDNLNKATEKEDDFDISNESEPIVIDPENMTPAELKRARKLQRRAERRTQKEVTGISA